MEHSPPLSPRVEVLNARVNHFNRHIMQSEVESVIRRSPRTDDMDWGETSLSRVISEDSSMPSPTKAGPSTALLSMGSVPFPNQGLGGEGQQRCVTPERHSREVRHFDSPHEFRIPAFDVDSIPMSKDSYLKQNRKKDVGDGDSLISRTLPEQVSPTHRQMNPERRRQRTQAVSSREFGIILNHLFEAGDIDINYR